MHILFTHSNWCACETHFDTGTVNPSTVYLEIDSLVSTGCTLDSYVIDWYLDSIANPKEFTTGEGSDPAIVYEHPFKVPVLDGTWIPVIRYIEVGGIKFKPRAGEPLDYCKLDSIIIDQLECGDSIGSAYANYDGTISYEANVNLPEEAEMEWNLYLIATSNYIPVFFQPEVVADKLTISYVSPVNSIDDVLIQYVGGQDCEYTDHLGNPRILGYYDFFEYPIGNVQGLPAGTIGRGGSSPTHSRSRFVLDISSYTYAVGDYIKFEVEPSIFTPSQKDTNWRIDFICLATFGSTHIDNDMNDLDLSTVRMEYDETYCRYKLMIDTVGGSVDTTTDFWKYYEFGTWMAGGCSNPAYASQPYACVSFPKRLIASYRYIYEYSRDCVTANGLITISKIGSQIKYSFASGTDYTYWKARYTWIVAHAHFIDYSADPTVQEHFKYIQIKTRLDLITVDDPDPCTGDNFVDHVLYVGPTAVWTFNDGSNYFTIDLVNTPDDYTEDPNVCDYRDNIITGSIYWIQNSYAATIPTPLTTNASNDAPMNLVYCVFDSTDVTISVGGVEARTPKLLADLGPLTFGAEWCLEHFLNYPGDTVGFDAYVFHFYSLYATIDDPDEPFTNFSIYNRLDAVTGCEGALPGTLIYESKGLSPITGIFGLTGNDVTLTHTT